MVVFFLLPQRFPSSLLVHATVQCMFHTVMHRALETSCLKVKAISYRIPNTLEADYHLANLHNTFKSVLDECLHLCKLWVWLFVFLKQNKTITTKLQSQKPPSRYVNLHVICKMFCWRCSHPWKLEHALNMHVQYEHCLESTDEHMDTTHHHSLNSKEIQSTDYF